MLVVPVVLLMFAANGCDESLPNVLTALQRNDIVRAVSLLQLIRGECAHSPGFHALNGIANASTGNFTEAAAEFKEALALKPELVNDPGILLAYARALLEVGQTATLTKWLDSRKRSLPPPVLFSLGTLFAKHSLYRQSIQYFEAIPTTEADDALYFNLALAHSHLRQFEDARKYYFLAIDKHPGYAEAYFRVGLDFAAAGDARKALPWLFRAKDLAPGRPDIAWALIEQLIPLKYLDTATQLTQEALAANPQDLLLTVAAGDLALAQGKGSEAAELYRNVLTQDPKLSSALLGSARVLVVQEKHAEARRILLDALLIDPENPAVCRELGSLEADDGDWTDAYSHLSKAWSIDRSNPTVALLLARSLRHLQRSGEALHTLQSVASPLRASPAFHSELAQIYAALGKTRDARSEREQMAALGRELGETIPFEAPKTYVH